MGILSFSSGVGENQLLDGRGAMAWNEAWAALPADRAYGLDGV
jgi:hypothetical protein